MMMIALSLSVPRPHPPIVPRINQLHRLFVRVATQPEQNQSFSVKIPVLESQPEIVPEPTGVPQSPEGSVREDLESGLLQELEQEKKQMIRAHGRPAY